MVDATSALVLLSGGQDSTTVLYLAKLTHEHVHALTINYGQRHAIELEAAVKVAKLAGVKSHEILEVGSLLKGTSPLTNADVDVAQYANADSLPGGLEATFVPARNALFLTLAANRAYVLGCDRIYIGVSQEDNAGYPDCRMDFIVSMEIALRNALDKGIHLKVPLIDLNKKETVWMAQEMDGCMDALAQSHTCYRGEYPPCGKCHACLIRARGFEMVGIEDPLVARAKREGLIPQLT
jgi:7-cyano-7-deazaguanine synthase